MSTYSISAEFETALKGAWTGTLKSVYWMTARVYNRVLVSALGYHAHELAADAFVRHWQRPGGAAGAVLDLGCGTGLTAEALLERVDVQIDGIDFSEAMLDRAEEKGIYRRLIEADVTRPLPVEPRSYSGAVSSGLFTHGHVGADALEPILAALAPGAIFAFTVYSTIWTRAGFDAELAKLERDGRIEVLDHQESGHFQRLRGQRVHVLTVRIV
ncbi:class I SAM-dependent DNA methyltransferase [Microbaculum marinum]|uniref:Methyltransferase domain-containing protein n=1 Tax=Microbaculum marinum TaxID=1764581 RepID=A0AAW9RED4_9HYPH